jgi:hydrogenase maturation factor
MKLPLGKIPKDLLETVVFRNLGAKRKEVALGPMAGFDAAVIDANGKSIIVSTDPITGALERIGWLAVNINANDIATFGVEPAFFLSCIMLPEKAQSTMISTISVQMNDAAKALGIAIVGGHCETTPGLAHPIVAGSAIGITDKGKYVTAGGAKTGDKLILTKSAGTEGTAILASDRKQELRKTLSAKTLRSATKLYEQISVVKDAMTAFKTGSVDAMHDPTEGGVAGGIHEMADAARLGVRICEGRIPIRSETHRICRHFQINPLQLVSSGALLISAKPKCAEEIVRALKRESIQASVIGEFLTDPNERTLIGTNGEQRALPRPLSDDLWLALSRK